jgi:hypothetical protein
VVLFPFLLVLSSLSSGWSFASHDLRVLLWVLTWRIDLGLLIFNILPIYPLDGGQILRALLWFPLGRARSLMAATILGFIGLAAFILRAIWTHNGWLVAISLYLLFVCWSGLQHARALLKFAKLPRRFGFACPSCQSSPPIGEYWKCGKCGQAFDSFQTGAVCPHCSTQYAGTKCLDCGAMHPMSEWAGHTVHEASTVPASTI